MPITIDEAIVGLEDVLMDDRHFDPERRREVAKLGIEALKYFKVRQTRIHTLNKIRLPGETEE